jgi:hypothetical protein
MATKAANSKRIGTFITLIAALVIGIVAFHGPAGQPGGTPLPSPVPSHILNQKPQPVLLNKATPGMSTWQSSEYDYDGKSIARIEVKATGASTLVCRILVNGRVVIERPQRANKFATCQIPFQPAKR